MSSATIPASATSHATSSGGQHTSHCKVINVQGQIRIPAWVDDLDSFRRWSDSDAYPESGSLSYLDDEIWVDLSMEEFITHNQVKFAFDVAIGLFLLRAPIGRFAGDRMRLTNKAVNLATEPDGLFYVWSTMQGGRLRLVPGAQGGFIELEGTPDMTLEIVSKSSVQKDTVALRELYWKAGVAEYWLVDARTDAPQFDIFRHTAIGYVATDPVDGWLASNVFGQSFRLGRSLDPLGHPQFVVETR